MAAVFTTEPSGAKFPRGNTSVAGQTALLRLFRRENDFIRLNPILLSQNFTKTLSPLRVFPPIQIFTQSFSGHSEHTRYPAASTGADGASLQARHRPGIRVTVG